MNMGAVGSIRDRRGVDYRLCSRIPAYCERAEAREAVGLREERDPGL
jgi:hypothetical protein